MIGAFLLLELPGTAFRHVVPFLILVACALVAFQPTLSRWLAPSGQPVRRFGHRGQLLYVAVFATGIYGGYFGAAQGVILISLLAIFIDERLQRLNAMKNVLVMLANLVSGVIFAVSGHVSWEAAGILAVGSTVGGQIGGRFGRRLPQPVLPRGCGCGRHHRRGAPPRLSPVQTGDAQSPRPYQPSGPTMRQ